MLRRPVLLKSFRVSRGNGEDGSTLIALALSLPILLSVVFGILAMCLALYSYFYVSYAAREGTRYAIVRGNDQPSDCTTAGYANCIAQTGDIQTYVRNLGFPGIKSSNLSVTTTWLTAAGAACGTADSCKPQGNIVQSTVTYTYQFIVPFVTSKSLSMVSKSQMVVAY